MTGFKIHWNNLFEMYLINPTRSNDYLAISYSLKIRFDKKLNFPNNSILLKFGKSILDITYKP